MPKSVREKKRDKTPYGRDAPKAKKSMPKKKHTKAISKSTRIKDAQLTDHLDNLLETLTPSISQSAADKTVPDTDVEQQQYEQTEQALGDTLDLLTRL